ncbi:TonB-dependent receptor [Bacteroides pyogenes]|uniref:TonB-dependent receptor n=1 Tax=Bacteroides pyogenes TaxID=310300 RepID=UPI001BA990EB|nr:TonB-dependent receptor [Bacteroides pyogenes]MBR8708197.1 hypothetical protein [Bacteroides pyogenes]MBR8716777.1 hypothetical protein [Bacteroides pyogenes]MBR8746568.1 hypothetical protein [Bacteroides pyogenes]MBR8756874.1 hypothetical protein [Bacteroides pyogenes]MBR8780066.1 hypothetical protein [Bacteroides pyogenes]
MKRVNFFLTYWETGSMKHFGIFCLIFFRHMVVAAQTGYTGKVADGQNKQPLEAVAVSLLAADSTIMSYSYTDSNGHFEIINRGTRTAEFLSFTYMGYRRVLLPARSFKNGTTVELEETTYKIKEVKITGQRIRKEKDTITYTVSGFRMPQDRTIEDVLKKIPGIEVTANGTIRFHDKPINRFYIEGMNLMEDKYALASKNIPADMVKEVQVLQSHQPIAALRGKTFSDHAALNLTLEDSHKNKLIKLIDAGIGAGNDPDVLWDNRLLGMLFGRRKQNLSMYKNNDTGKDIAAEILPLGQSGVIDISRDEEDAELFPVSISQNKEADPSRYLFNDAHLGAINHLYKPDKTNDIRLQLSFLHQKERAEYRSGTTYFYPSQTITVDEREQYNGQENRAEGEFTYQLNDSALFLKNKIKGLLGLHKSSLNLWVNDEKTGQRTHPQRKFLHNHFELVKNTRRHSFSIYSANSYRDLPQHFTVEPGLYEELLNQNNPYGKFAQDARLQSFQSDAYTYFQHKIAGWYLKYKAGISYARKKMSSALSINDTPAGDEYHNDLTLKTLHAYIEPRLNFKNDFWDVQFSIPLSFYHAGLRTERPQSEQSRKNLFLPAPSLNVKYEFSPYLTLIGRSSLSCIQPDILKLYGGYMFTSYRSAFAFHSKPVFDKSYYNSIGVRFVQPLTGFFASLTGFYTLNKQELIYGYRNKEKYLSVTETYDRPHTNHLYGVNGKLSKTFAWSKLYTSVGMSYSNKKDKMLLEERMANSTMQVYSLRFDFSLRPVRSLSFEGSSSAIHTLSQLDLPENGAVKAWSFHHTIDLNIVFSQHWKGRVTQEISHNNRNRKATYFADASLLFSHRLFEIEFAVNNLLNHSTLNHTYIDHLTQRYSANTLRPRECLIKAMFSF